MRQIFTIAFVATLLCSCNQQTKNETKEKEVAMLLDTQKTNSQDEWDILFDGASLEGWHAYGQTSLSEHWKIEDYALVFYPPKNRKQGESYNLVTNNTYTNFVLSVEWRISEGGNSGIFWGVFEDEKYGQPYETGPEIQVLDNDKHPDGKNGTSHQAGALYDMVSPSKDVTKPVGQWNVCEITVNHKINEGKVVLNGEEITSFKVNGSEWDAMVAKSKFASWQGFGKYPTGKIGLQDHGDKVSYRNIKIKEL